MFNGTVNFVAKMDGDGLTFPRFDFDSNEAGVDKIEIEGPNGGEIRSTVLLSSVATQDDGRTLAENVITAVLNRITFYYGRTIGNAIRCGEQFSLVNSKPGERATLTCTSSLRAAAKVVRSVSASQLKVQLEQIAPPGERNFGLLRSALLSESPVEEFMHLYHILLMLFLDKQADIDSFIVREDLAVPQTQHLQRLAGKMETIYTRLRNELEHERPGVIIDHTKAEMSNRLSGLLALTKLAIEQNP